MARSASRPAESIPRLAVKSRLVLEAYTASPATAADVATAASMSMDDGRTEVDAPSPRAVRAVKAARRRWP
eukprot:scaffold14318_cov96-Isochrysis_galbana.AAC.1